MDELGYAGYGHNEHHLQIEGFEATNHPGMFSQFIGNNSTRLPVNTLGYVAPTHNYDEWFGPFAQAGPWPSWARPTR